MERETTSYPGRGRCCSINEYLFESFLTNNIRPSIVSPLHLTWIETYWYEGMVKGLYINYIITGGRGGCPSLRCWGGIN